MSSTPSDTLPPGFERCDRCGKLHLRGSGYCGGCGYGYRPSGCYRWVIAVSGGPEVRHDRVSYEFAPPARFALAAEIDVQVIKEEL